MSRTPVIPYSPTAYGVFPTPEKVLNFAHFLLLSHVPDNGIWWHKNGRGDHPQEVRIVVYEENMLHNGILLAVV